MSICARIESIEAVLKPARHTVTLLSACCVVGVRAQPPNAPKKMSTPRKGKEEKARGGGLCWPGACVHGQTDATGHWFDNTAT